MYMVEPTVHQVRSFNVDILAKPMSFSANWAQTKLGTNSFKNSYTGSASGVSDEPV